MRGGSRALLEQINVVKRYKTGLLAWLVSNSQFLAGTVMFLLLEVKLWSSLVGSGESRHSLCSVDLNMMRLKQILRTRQLQLLSKTKPVEPEIRMSFILILSDLVYLSGGERGTGPQLSHTRTTRQSWTAVQPKRNQTHVFLYKRLTLRKLDKVVCDFITTNYLP